MRMTKNDSRKKAQKAQKILFKKSFVPFVPFCG